MVIANGEVLIDYAFPCMMAERSLKKLHNMMLEGKHEEAISAGLEALADVRLTIQAVKDMQERSAK